MKYCFSTIHKITIFLILITIGCNSNKENPNNWDIDNTREVQVNDSTYNNAIKKAKQNLPLFVELLKDRELNKYDFYIKSRHTDGKEAEHMWFAIDDLKNKSVIGILDNIPLKLKNIKLNDKVEIQFSEIEDWVIYKGDSIVAGNYIANTII